MGYDLPQARLSVQSELTVPPVTNTQYAAIFASSRGPLAPRLVSSIAQLLELYGVGAGVRETAYQLGKTGIPVVVRRILPTARAGYRVVDLSAWTGANPVTATGTPNNYYKIVLEITTPGAVGVAAGRYSTDGGDTYTSPAVLLDPQPIGSTGVSLDFGAANLAGTVTVEAYPASQAVCGTIITRAAASNASPSIAGTPVDVYQIRVEILQGGTLGAATPAIRYRVSLDNGRTWQNDRGLGTALTAVLRDSKDGLDSDESTGLTLTFGIATATLDTGDVITAYTTEPVLGSADVSAALTELRAAADGWEFAHVVEPIATFGAGVAAVGGTVQSFWTGTIGGQRFTWLLNNARRRYPTESLLDYEVSVPDADFLAMVNSRVAVGGEHALVTCPVTGRRNARSVALVALCEFFARPVEQEASRVKTGALSSDVAIYESGEQIHYDAQKSNTLNFHRFITLRTYDGGPAGLYVTRSSTFDVQDGEESRVPRRRVLDRLSGLFQQLLVLNFVGEGLPLDDQGRIDPGAADLVDAALDAALQNEAAGRVSRLEVKVDRTLVLSTTTPVSSWLKVVGLEYVDQVRGKAGFVPASALAAEEG